MERNLEKGFITVHGAELQKFFHEVITNGYGNTTAKVIERADYGKTIQYGRRDWYAEDTFYGGEPFSGMTVIWYKGVPCLTMTYWGKVLPNADKEAVYPCLSAALRAANPQHPWRGPNQFEANGLRYTNMWHGMIEKFYGQEKIGDAEDNWLYECDYCGGIINLR